MICLGGAVDKRSNRRARRFQSSIGDPRGRQTTTAFTQEVSIVTTNQSPAITQSIVEIASTNPEFSTLVAAVSAAGLAGTLSGAGPFTVFAPTNKAFAAVPAGTLEMLLKPENKAALASILTYHVVAGSVFAKDVKPGQVPTVNGAKFTVSASDGTVHITDGKGNKAKVVMTDIAATNGVIHVIDTVLLP
jgi:uncharacterized surface protein with fasciclin (FAS1) repeats